MNSYGEWAVAAVWDKIEQGIELSTPAGQAVFTVAEKTADAVTVRTTGGNSVRIGRQNFIAAVNYLASHCHVSYKPCLIRSNADPLNAGPLCVASRFSDAGVLGTRVITYILPILQSCNVVGINAHVPTSTWLL